MGDARWCYPEWALCAEDVQLSKVPWHIPPAAAASTAPCMHSWGLRMACRALFLKAQE